MASRAHGAPSLLVTSSYVFGTHERSQKMHSCSCIPGRPRTKEACSRTGQPSSKSPSGPGYSNFQLRFWSMKSCLVSERLKVTTRRCQRSELSLERLVATCPSRIRLEVCLFPLIVHFKTVLQILTTISHFKFIQATSQHATPPIPYHCTRSCCPPPSFIR